MISTLVSHVEHRFNSTKGVIMFTRNYGIELAERAITTYVISLVTLIVAAPSFHISIPAAFGWALLPTGLDTVRGLVAGAFGSTHNTLFVDTQDEATAPAPSAQPLALAA
jgi:hypothetical protein